MNPTDPLVDPLQDLLACQQDILAINYLAPLSTHYLPWSGYAMAPRALVQIINDIVLNQRSLIVECGSGISTFYIARLLKQLGTVSHLYSIEHDQAWFNWVQQQLIQEGLTSIVTLIYAPLKSTDLALDDALWYDLESISQKLPKDIKIDLLLVDGPPAYRESIQYSRYPALPYFLPQLNDPFMVVIDDANRPGESAIIKKWQEIHKLNFEIRDGNIAIATH
ncbi:MAG: class I SAM-dependent methyltransferase [Leptolyngbyaceae bacterium]|nr:class I SAM-dependent methyltransferase [Leptolyngbyaceae bacterium]